MMGAMVVRSPGGPEQLEWAEVPRPVPERDEVLARVEACGVNHLDLHVRRGLPGNPIELPHILGSEPVGIVDELGPEAEAASASAGRPVKAGDRVIVAPGFLERFHAGRSGPDSRWPDYRVIGSGSPGGYGEFVKARAENLVTVSDRWTPEEWAATPLVFLTAWHMLVGRARLRPGETVLVLAAGSGVGSAAVQIGRHFGCRVIATAGADWKLERAAELGADEGVDHSDPDWPQAVRALTGGGVDVVVEHVGEATFSKAVTTLAPGGRLVTCGATTGPAAELHLVHLFAKQLSVLGSYMGDFRDLLDVVALLSAGHLHPVVDRVFPVREAAAAHRRLEEREAFGKIVLKHG
jgi:NADPH:quinone reductase-like Zn-dependent oxidoreductase